MAASVSIDLARQERISARLYLVKPIALHIRAKLPQSVSLEDLVQWGFLGLIAACDNYQPAQADHFDFYAKLRIRGAILNGLRSQYAPHEVADPIEPGAPSIHERAAELSQALERLTQQQRQVVSLRMAGHSYSSIARKLGVCRQAVQQMEQRALHSLRAQSQALSHAA